MTMPASSSRRARAVGSSPAQFDQVEHRELVEVACALAVAAEARAHLEDAEGLPPEAAEAPHEGVEVRRQHGPQAASVLEPEDLLAQRMSVIDPHLVQRLRGDDVRRDDLDESELREGGAQGALELEQRRRALAGAQLLQTGAARAGEAVLGSA